MVRIGEAKSEWTRCEKGLWNSGAGKVWWHAEDGVGFARALKPSLSDCSSGQIAGVITHAQFRIQLLC